MQNYEKFDQSVINQVCDLTSDLTSEFTQFCVMSLSDFSCMFIQCSETCTGQDKLVEV